MAIAKMQSSVGADDLMLLLQLQRAGTLTKAAERQGVDSSTLFRALQKLERRLGLRLFQRGRHGYQATEITLSLLPHAERLESEVLAACQLLQQPVDIQGIVRLTTTDLLFDCLLCPVLAELQQRFPGLVLEVATGNELVSLTRRDADFALRAAESVPEHLIGKALGQLDVALFCHQQHQCDDISQALQQGVGWIAVDQALPQHPTVLWRKKHYPQHKPTVLASSVLAVQQLVASGTGMALLPVLQARRFPQLRQISPVISEASSVLWLLAHPEMRHLNRLQQSFHLLHQGILALLQQQQP